jgi:hypothetical protein
MAATATREPVQKRAIPPPGNLPKGFHLSNVWLDADGKRVEGDDHLPVNSTTLRLAAVLYLCTEAGNGCEVGELLVDKGDGAEVKPKKQFCPDHGVPLHYVPLDENDPRAISGARRKMGERVAAALRRRRERVLEVATARLLDAQNAVLEAGKRTAADYTAHAPSLAAAAIAITAGVAVAEAADPLSVAAAACAFAVAGGVIAYAAAFLYSRERARQRGSRITPGSRAYHGAQRNGLTVATATAAAGFWTAADAGLVAAGHGQGTVLGTLMLGAAVLAAWLIGRGHWEHLTERRKELRRLAQQRAAEKAAELATQVEQVAAAVQEPELTAPFDENDPHQVGARMAREWERISALPDTQNRFAVMPRTRILPELTRAVMAPTPDGGQRRIGWEFIIQGDPGVLVPPAGLPSPVISARVWLAAMLDRDPMNVATVERPDGEINRAVLLLTDGAPLGEPVPYLGRAGIQVLSNGTILGHDGRDIKGRDTFMPLYIPGQTFGGLVAGRSGGGKSQARRIRILNNLYAGIFTTMYDPKNFVDYSEFAGIIPMGCTTEHRDVILRSLWAEMVRRQQMLSQLVGRDRFNRVRPIEGAWNVKRDGPPILSMWDEFHLESKEADYVARMTTLARLQRATASGVELASQGGSLADWGDSVLRMLLNQTGMEIYKMSKTQAGLAGYQGDFDPNDLPSVPGMVLKVFGEGGQPIPQRSAFAPRDDVDGSVYDHLYAPDGSQILFLAPMPDATTEVFEQQGLMDLLRMGQGEGGLARLQAGNGDSTLPPPGTIPVGGEPARGKPIEARDMILAILARGPVANRGQIDNHPMWLQDPNRDKLPNPSTISVPTAKLERDGLVVNPKREDVWRQLTPAGQRAGAQALLAFEVAVGRHVRSDAPVGVPESGESPARTEHQVLKEHEERQMALDATAKIDD